MNHKLIAAALELQGWVPICNRNRTLSTWGISPTWGISHAQHGTIKEDAWHKQHGPTVAPLRVIPHVEHFEMPVHIVDWTELGPLTLRRLYREAETRGYL